MIRLVALFVAISKHFNDGGGGGGIYLYFINVTKHFCGAATCTRYTLCTQNHSMTIAHLKLECTIKLHTQTPTLIAPYLSVDNPWLYYG